MKSRRWSLAGRLTRLVAITTTGIVLSVIATSVWLLRQSVDRELRALLAEEAAELDAVFSPSEPDPAEFVRIAGVLDRLHPANPLAWRAWNADGTVFAEHDPHELLGLTTLDAPGLDEHEARTHGSDGLRWRVDMLSNGMTLAVVVDGSAQLGVIEHFGALSITLTFLATAIVVGVGSALCLRSARGLRRIAEDLRTLPAGNRPPELDVEGAPEEIRAVAGALVEMLANLRRDREQARLLTAGLAHELRSPLQNLHGEVEVALLRERTTAEYQRTLQSQLEELDDLRRVVDNLVVLTSPSEPSGGDLEAFDLGEEIALRSERERKVAERKAVDLALEVQGNVVVTGDREVLLLAVSNLLSNAIRFTPPRGEVRVRVEGTGSDVVVTVDDSGRGVPRDERERIFETFFQGRHSDQGRIGYGLGLALAKRAVELHAGSIEVDDAPAGGARFRIVLPRARPAERGQPAA